MAEIVLVHGTLKVCFQHLQYTRWSSSTTRNKRYDTENKDNFPKIWQKAELIVLAHAIWNIAWWIEFRIGIFDIEGNEKVIFNHKKLKIYLVVLCNCKKRFLRRFRTHHNTSTFMPIDQIIFRKPDLLFIDGQVQLAKNTFTL